MRRLTRTTLVSLPLLLTACQTVPQAPAQPVLSCDNCQGLTYYGQPAPPPKHPAIAALETVARAATTIAGAGFAADTLKSITDTTATAGTVQVVETAAAPTIVRPEIVRPEIVTP